MDLPGSNEGLNSRAWRLFRPAPNFAPVAGRDPRLAIGERSREPGNHVIRRWLLKEPRALPALRRCATVLEATGREVDRLCRDWEEDVDVQDAYTIVMPRAVCAHAAAGGRGQDLLLDFARLAGRPRLDLFPRRGEHVGQGHRPDRQNLVPQRRRRLAAGSDPRRDRRQGGWDRNHQPGSRQPRRKSSRRRAQREFRSSTSTRPTRK